MYIEIYINIYIYCPSPEQVEAGVPWAVLQSHVGAADGIGQPAPQRSVHGVPPVPLGGRLQLQQQGGGLRAARAQRQR